MPWIYSDHGRAFEWREPKDGVRADKGEVAFVAHPSEAELLAAFPQRAATVKAAALVKPARQALDATDNVVLRCLEAGLAVPAEWRAYRKALRDIVAGRADPANPMPVQPAFPPNT